MRGTIASSAKELDGVCVDTVALAGMENHPHDIRNAIWKKKHYEFKHFVENNWICTERGVLSVARF